MAFRKVGGFVYVMSVLVSMEGCLADPPKAPWHQGTKLAVFVIVLERVAQLYLQACQCVLDAHR